MRLSHRLTKEQVKLLKSSLPDKRRSSIEILQKVCVRNKEMITTDLERCSIIYTELEDGMYDLVGELLVPIDGDVRDYPDMPNRNLGHQYMIDKFMIKKLQKLAKICSTDTTRPVLCNIRISNGVAYATDGYKMMRTKMDLPDCYISPKFVRRLAIGKLWKFSASEDAICAGHAGVDIMEKQVYGQYPDCTKLFPPKYGDKYAVIDVHKDLAYRFDGTDKLKVLVQHDIDKGAAIEVLPVFDRGEVDKEIETIVMPLLPKGKDNIDVSGATMYPIGKKLAVFFGERNTPCYVIEVK